MPLAGWEGATRIEKYFIIMRAYDNHNYADKQRRIHICSENLVLYGDGVRMVTDFNEKVISITGT